MHLVLNSYGASLSRENGLFSIYTPEGSQTFPPDKVKTISICKAARITSDAVLLAIQNGVDILFVNEMGQPEGRVWSVKYGSISEIRKSQIDFLYSDKIIPWIKKLLAEKLNNQIAILLAFQPAELPGKNIFKHAVNGIEDHMKKIQQCEGESLSDLSPSLRGWEGAASRKYFQALGSLMPKYFAFSQRNRLPAQDPFNAMLNYGYGILYGKIEGALIKAGIDPYVGIFHRDDYNRPALVFDVIEKYRHWIDYIVIQLAMQDALTEECFSHSEASGVLLAGIGKRILIQSVNDYLSEIILLNNLERSRAAHIDLEMHRTAQYFLKHG